ncbi:MAG: ArsA family ATPase [Desulfobacterales bacterium]|nr:ArsA family ATPase [Desulfobacterales bacterium]
MSLFDKRLIFVLGKGGVGKTTIAASLGLAAHKLGKKVLLLEVGDADSIGPLINNTTLPFYPKEIYPKLWGARINPRLVIEDYVYVQVGFTFIASRITKSKIFDHLVDVAPGLKEVMTLGQIWRWDQEIENGSNRFDITIIDAPATGHGLGMLRVLPALIEMINFGPIAEQSKVVLNLLKNQEKTWITLVTLPEELPVNEAIEFRNIAEKDLDMPVNVTFINGVYPEIFNLEEQEDIYKHLNNSTNTNPNLINIFKSAQDEIIRYKIQKNYIKQIKTGARGFVIEVPFFFTNELKIENVKEIASLILKSTNYE